MENEALNEEKVIEQAIEGNLNAFNWLVSFYQTMVYNTALRILKDPALADDLTQTAFINAWKHMDSFKGNAFKPWILRITMNACYDELRRLRRHPVSPLEPVSADETEENEDAEWMIDPDASPSEQFDQREQMRTVKDCLGELPDSYRGVVLMIDVEEQDYQTAADILGIPLGTIKSRLMRARLRMRDCLKTKGNF